MHLIEVKAVSHSYGNRSFLMRTKGRAPVLKNVHLTIEEGTCLGLLGQSGAGKSTLGRIILGLEKPRAGQVLFEGQDIIRADQRTHQHFRRHVQAVFQDSYSAVNPRWTVEQILSEPLENYEPMTRKKRQHILIHWLERVGLSEQDLSKYPYQFSGGQLQRINIARALVLQPKLIVLDESVSSLDMVTQAVILDLLVELKKELKLAYLFITHDLTAAYHLSDQLAILDQGELVAQFHSKDDFFISEHEAVLKMKEATLASHPLSRTIGRPVR
ncbi:ABC transporter ATP-binding protein [Bacillus altitudinis]|uniref:ABC transporter ATP-binding protein n=1 Tax=Bacillus altitudinis TaxID=293387 RepID=UPI000ACE93D9|nr:dipeptide/oligopeptide/nickel ABC transporter ATP-binding protein [Bacillus altitudinis]WLF32183.1 dipeptide/oligopeptide/nickel ABC transporter ATP-binding protein [Bacillus altitudinis]GJI57652.1 ABC transporter ATP-binding protein [Bacillus altitudinis]